MRQLVVLSDEVLCSRLAAYLVAQEIRVQVDGAPQAWEVWVRDEDRLAQAQQILAEFQANPDDPRYQGHESAAARRLREEEERRRRIAANMIDGSRHWGNGSAGSSMGMAGGAQGFHLSKAFRDTPVTMLLFAVSAAVFGWMNLAENGFASTLIHLAFANLQTADETTIFADIQHGQFWRLFTPMFIHFGIMHIAFNMLWLLDLGRQAERQEGSLRFGLGVLIVAAVSNSVQAWVIGPNFGGMSGVVCGLIGFVWMRQYTNTAAGYFFHPQSLLFALVYFALCFAQEIPSLAPMVSFMGVKVANYAHGGGLVAGMAIGFLQGQWIQRRKR